MIQAEIFRYLKSCKAARNSFFGLIHIALYSRSIASHFSLLVVIPSPVASASATAVLVLINLNSVAMEKPLPMPL